MNSWVIYTSYTYLHPVKDSNKDIFAYGNLGQCYWIINNICISKLDNNSISVIIKPLHILRLEIIQYYPLLTFSGFALSSNIIITLIFSRG